MGWTKACVYRREWNHHEDDPAIWPQPQASERCVDFAPHGHWNTNTFIAALRHDRIDAPMLFDGSMNSDVFLNYVEKVLTPTLEEGDLVICDNLSMERPPEELDRE